MVNRMSLASATKQAKKSSLIDCKHVALDVASLKIRDCQTAPFGFENKMYVRWGVEQAEKFGCTAPPQRSRPGYVGWGPLHQAESAPHECSIRCVRLTRPRVAFVAVCIMSQDV